MKLRITTLIIVEEGQVQDIYHSLNDNQDKAYQEIINQVNAEYGETEEYYNSILYKVSRITSKSYISKPKN
jgi:hypothetical protein